MSDARSAFQSTTPRPTGRWRKLLLLSGTVLFSVLIACLLLEAGFRLIRTEPWYERVAQAQKRAEGVRYPVGDLASIQLRKMPPRTPKAPGTYRILFLGDSFTYGSGVEDGSKVFVDLVAQRLNSGAKRPGIRKYETFNGGMPGSMTRHWVQLLKKMANSFQPDMVVGVFFLRDGADPEITSVHLVREIEEGMNRLAERSLLYRYSHMYRFFRQRSEFKTVSREYLDAIQRAYVGAPEQTREWQLARENLLWIRQQALLSGSRFAMIVFPVLLDLDEDYPLRGVCDILQRFCELNEIPVLSLLPAFMNRDASELWVSLYDQHPNEEGHAIAAEAVLPFLESLLAPPKWKEWDQVPCD
ncbi:MAG: SGNH/GDSL hydrolase family protein [Planctomycetota bacterium]